jgi:hypothetical protein
MLPRSLAHPVNEVTKAVIKAGRHAHSVTSDTAGTVGKEIHKVARKTGKLLAR